MSERRKEALAVCALLALCGAFLFFASRDLSLPGLWYDEATEAVYGMELATGLPPSPANYGLLILGHWTPLVTSGGYDLGAFFILWSALAFKLGGVSVVVLRWASLAVAAGVLLALYALARLWSTRELALTAVLLLAVDPVFFIWSRHVFLIVEWAVVLFGLCAAVLGSVWYRERKAWALPAAAFALGFGLNATVKSLVYVLGLPAVFLAFAPRERRPSLREAADAAVYFAVGALWPIIYNLLAGLDTLRTLWARGASSPPLLEHAATRVRQFLDLALGAAPAQAAGPFGRDLVGGCLRLAAVGGGIAAWLAARSRRLGGVLLFGALAYAFTHLSPSALTEQHLVVLWPCVTLLAACAVAWLHGRPFRGAKVAALAAVLSVAAADVRFDAAYLRELRRGGGAGLWSDAISRLAGYFDARPSLHPYALSWGISENVYLLTQGRVHPRTAHRFLKTPLPSLEALYSRSFEDRQARYVMIAEGVRPNQGEESGDYALFRKAASLRGRRLALESTAADRAGRPVYLIYRAD